MPVRSWPPRAYVLAYDAARFACNRPARPARPAPYHCRRARRRRRRGPRPVRRHFWPFGTLRRRRNELEYPHTPGATATSDEAEEAAATAQALIAGTAKLLDHLTFYD
jgi:hypothetical protein